MDYRYWDSATFLGWLKAEADKVNECRPVLEAAEAGEITIITSAITIAEVLRLKGHERIEASQAKKSRHSFVTAGSSYGKWIDSSRRNHALSFGTRT